MNKLALHNLRLGLATNSSSSHSMIFFPSSTPPAEHPAYDDYGWDNFTLTSAESKIDYFIAQLRYSLDALPETVQRAVMGMYIGDRDYDPDRSVDHQSIFAVPHGFNTNFPDPEFWEDLMAFAARSDLVILGGNDNSSGHPLRTKDAFEMPFTDSFRSDVVCRKDPQGFWTLFQQSGGTKMRISFTGRDGIAATPQRAYSPELVDIKITDHCPFGCKFCYQGSTAQGVHAEFSDISRILSLLEGAKVFEVAYGGGEPTLHPDFISILEATRAHGIVPNFTTKSLHWLRDPQHWVPIMKHCGSFAYSVSSANDIENLSALLKVNGLDRQDVALHLVMGTFGKSDFEGLLKTADVHHFRVTLLGYKTDGRGADFKPTPYEWWLSVCKTLADNHKLPSLSIDTALAAQYETGLLSAGIPKWMFHTQDGLFSAYIDAVAMKLYPSSYGGYAGVSLPGNEYPLPVNDFLRLYRNL